MTGFDFTQVTPHQQRIADAIMQKTGVFFVHIQNEYALICDVEEALPKGEEAVVAAFYASGDLLDARGSARAVIEAMEGQRLAESRLGWQHHRSLELWLFVMTVRYGLAF